MVSGQVGTPLAQGSLSHGENFLTSLLFAFPLVLSEPWDSGSERAASFVSPFPVCTGNFHGPVDSGLRAVRSSCRILLFVSFISHSSPCPHGILIGSTLHLASTSPSSCKPPPPHYCADSEKPRLCNCPSGAVRRTRPLVCVRPFPLFSPSVSVLPAIQFSVVQRRSDRTAPSDPGTDLRSTPRRTASRAAGMSSPLNRSDHCSPMQAEPRAPTRDRPEPESRSPWFLSTRPWRKPSQSTF